MVLIILDGAPAYSQSWSHTTCGESPMGHLLSLTKAWTQLDTTHGVRRIMTLKS